MGKNRLKHLTMEGETLDWDSRPVHREVERLFLNNRAAIFVGVDHEGTIHMVGEEVGIWACQIPEEEIQ